MTDKITRGMGDETTPRDASKMTSNSHRTLYIAIALIIAIIAGFAVYSAYDNRAELPSPQSTTQ